MVAEFSKSSQAGHRACSNFCESVATRPNTPGGKAPTLSGSSRSSKSRPLEHSPRPSGSRVIHPHAADSGPPRRTRGRVRGWGPQDPDPRVHAIESIHGGPMHTWSENSASPKNSGKDRPGRFDWPSRHQARINFFLFLSLLYANACT